MAAHLRSPNSVASGSLLFDKKEKTLIGFYTQQEADGDSWRWVAACECHLRSIDTPR